MLRDVNAKILTAFKDYPLKRRAIFALSSCILLLVVTLNWRFETAKTIAICAFVVACLFDKNGKAFLFFLGIMIGDLLLYAST